MEIVKQETVTGFDFPEGYFFFYFFIKSLQETTQWTLEIASLFCKTWISPQVLHFSASISALASFPVFPSVKA